MKFGKGLSQRGNFPYSYLKRIVDLEQEWFVPEFLACIRGIVLAEYHINRIDYMGIMKILKKYEKKHGISLFEVILPTLEDKLFWKVYYQRLRQEFLPKYPTYHYQP